MFDVEKTIFDISSSLVRYSVYFFILFLIQAHISCPAQLPLQPYL